MRYIFALIFCVLLIPCANAQENNLDTKIELDSLYREDQFYFGFTYGLLTEKPDGISQSGFSVGIMAGFIRDMPINKRRNVSIGLGVGYSYNSFNNNLAIYSDDNGKTIFNPITDLDVNYSVNRLMIHQVEIPLEFRWRTSTAEKHKFWRIYGGFKLGYTFANRSKFKGDLGTIKYSDINEFNKLRYGATLSALYGAVNLHIYYGLNPLFEDSTKLRDGSVLEMSNIQIGLIFYIL
ncbi:porin family protein [Mangrovimonas aestuarii]|uniref:porin family protein n=1 Tax=Mangrovimonas aestuarii TaxID=3018443 RepID=UPI002378D2E8|nr:porin family protein [Mangrovimonas aestuarii]